MTPQAEFAALYERHHQALYRYCRSIVRHEEDAKDALQSTMTRAYAALQEKPHDFDLRPWLFRIAHNESVSILRRRRPMQELDAELAALGGVDERAEAQETLRIFRQDLADLPERQRSALVLRELNGLRPAEIATLLETTPGAVKQSLLEARKALSKCNEGRETPCFDVQRALMDGDGRVLRGRGLRAHLRSCAGCRRFRDDVRPRKLAALPALLGALQGSGLFAKTAIVAVVAVTATAEVRSLRAPGDPVSKRARPAPTATATPLPASRAATLTPALATRPAATQAAHRHAAAAPATRSRRAHRRAHVRTVAPAAKPHPTPTHAAAPPGHAKTKDAAPKLEQSAPPGQAKAKEAAPKHKQAKKPDDPPPGLANKPDEQPPGLAKQDETPSGQAKQQEKAAAKAEKHDKS